jgi:hypothetical protein
MSRILCAIMLLVSVASYAAERNGIEYVSYEFRIVVPKTEESIRSIVDQGRKAKGLVLFYSADRVDLRVPLASVDGLVAQIRKSGYIDDEKIVRSDVGEELARLKAQLKVKEEYISRLYKLTESADLGGTLDAEKALETANGELDQFKSDIRKLERMGRFADISVVLTGPRSLPSDRGKSRWPFLNSLGVEHSMEESK